VVFFSSRRRHTRSDRDWSSDVCSSDLGGGGGFMTSRGTANVLTRATATLAGVFFLTSLVLSILAGWDRKPRSILQGGQTQTQPRSEERRVGKEGIGRRSPYPYRTQWRM